MNFSFCFGCMHRFAVFVSCVFHFDFLMATATIDEDCTQKMGRNILNHCCSIFHCKKHLCKEEKLTTEIC